MSTKRTLFWEYQPSSKRLKEDPEVDLRPYMFEMTLEELESPKISKTRKQYSTKYKLDIIEEAKNSTSREIARKNDLDECQIRKWRQQEEKLRKAWIDSPKSMKIGSGRTPINMNFEKEIVEFLKMKNQKVTRSNIKNLALKLAAENYPQMQFHASDGWITNFLRRNQLDLKKMEDKNSIKNYFKAKAEPNITDES